MGSLDKEPRLRRLRELLQRNEISSQEQLAELLAVEGFSIAQSTLSRDLRELAVSKRDGLYHLPQGAPAEAGVMAELRERWIDRIDFVDCGGTTVVLRPRNGTSSSEIRQALEGAALPSVVAVTHTEDTTLVITRSAAQARELVRLLRTRPRRAWRR